MLPPSTAPALRTTATVTLLPLLSLPPVPWRTLTRTLCTPTVSSSPSASGSNFGGLIRTDLSFFL